MSNASNAGTLMIEIMTNLSRLQEEMEQIKRSVGGMESDVVRKVKAVNDNFKGLGVNSGVPQFSRDVAKLKAELEPAWAATQKYKQEQQLLQKALAEGAISGRVYGQEMVAAAKRLQEMRSATGAATAASGAQRAGLQQLGFQLGDAATMFASGSSATQIFGTQLGQTLQAVQLMAGGTSGLAAFLGGPWGIALSVAAIATAPFIGKLWEIVSGATAATGALQGLIEKQRQQAAEKNKLRDAEKDLDALIQRRGELESEIAQRGVRNANGQLQFVYKQQKELAEVNRQIMEGRSALDNERASAVSLDKTMGDLAAQRLRSIMGIEKHTRAHVAKIKVDKDDVDQTKKWLSVLDEEMRKLRDLASMMNLKPASGFEEMILKNNEAFNKAAEASRAYGDSLRELQDIAGEIDLSTIFGNAGAGVEEMIGVVERLAAAQQAYGDALYQAGEDQSKIAAVQAAYEKARVNGTIAMLGASKKLFAEQSTGYKVISAAEKAFAAMKLINAIKSMAMDSTQTASSVANSAVRATADQAAGASKMFSQLGVWAFPAVAAMIALLVSLGVKGGGGGGSYRPPSAEDMQAGIGTGTVLGDSSAQSQSIANALQIMAENSNSDLEYSNDMVKYLRNISDGIGNLTAQIARQVGLGGAGMFSTGNLNLGTTGSNGVLGLFGSSTTRSLYDQGIQLFNFKIGEVLQQGVQAQVYNVVEQVKKSSGFLGIGGGTKTTYQTITGTVSQQIKDQFGLIVNDVAESVVAFVTEIGKQTSLANVVNIEQQARDYINSLTLPGATLSFKDMSGDEIEKALNAYFSSVADQIAMMTAGLVGLSDLSQFQKAGEGLYETLSRITRTFMTVNTTLKSVGADQITAVAGNSSAQAVFPVIQNLVDQFGGLDAFQEAVSNFGDTFLTEAERMAPIIDSVRAEMARLGQSGITTNDQFKQLVWSLDLSTESGQAMFAQLMSVAPAFAKTTEYLASLNGEVQETGKTAAQLAAIEKDRRALQIQIMELQGDAEGALAAKRADALAALDASLRPLQEQVNALQDQAAAAEAARVASEALAAAQAKIANERAGLEQQLLQLQGNTTALRERELAALDPSNRALMQQIYALQDQATAAQAAAEATAAAAAEQERIAQEAAAKAEQIASERYGLEGQLLQLMGDTAAIRQRELDALDPSNRALLERIHALQDEQAAAQAAAALAAEQERAAQAAAAEAQARANERMALGRELLTALGDTAALRRLELQAIDPANRELKKRIWAIQDEQAALAAATALANSRRALEIQLMEATGDAAGALAAKRADELAAMDASLRALQQQVWAEQDAAAARAAAAAAAEEARRKAEAAREEALRRAEEIAKARTDLQIQLLEAQGRSAEALAMKRQMELAAMDASLRGLQQQVWAAQDAAAAREKLTSSYRDMISEWQASVDTFGGLADDLRAYRKSLTEPDGNSAAGYAARRMEFQRLSALAAGGDKAAMQGLQGAGDAFLASAMANAGSMVQYQRDLSLVLQGLDKSIFAADETADYAQLQVDALNRQIELLEGIAQNTAVPANSAVPAAPSTVTTSAGTVSASSSLEAEVKALRQDLNAALIAIKQDTGKTARTLERVTDNDRIRVGNDLDSPVYTSAVP